ncbi:hypothetical protein EBBID32_33360 [Sphingobium indicum BiD32]|uniref:Uncharacterized protein n=1 Tax=Sphingobium indicum BiD32 TaxID=1301087 RepID=N1MUD3_9SPHN|nr:hypothetical protein [Sphingobium indicum]CCW18978.1 hypothetical protein EBBID32_33360 [Sphingobium indicum BiD32]
MPGSSRSYALDISAELFKLTTESIRLHSNETLRYQTLAQLLTQRISNPAVADNLNPAELREYLDVLPTRGSIRIHLNISRTSAQSLVEIKKRLSREIGNTLTVSDAVALLIYDYLVEHSATRVLPKLGLADPGSAVPPKK